MHVEGTGFLNPRVARGKVSGEAHARVPLNVLMVCVGVVVSVATLGLMRYPYFRRAQFRGYGAFSLIVSLLCAAGVLLMTVLMVIGRGT